MSYYVLRPSSFNKSSETPRVLYLLKKRDVPVDEVEDIVHLQCSSVKRVESISEFLSYLQMNTSDVSYSIKPYIIKRVKWNEAVDIFGLDFDSETSESENLEPSGSEGRRGSITNGMSK
jgi:hypothetical protein